MKNLTRKIENLIIAAYISSFIYFMPDTILTVRNLFAMNNTPPYTTEAELKNDLKAEKRD